MRSRGARGTDLFGARAPPGVGSWLVLPAGPHGRKLAAALAARLGRPVVRHAASWYRGPGLGDLGVVSDTLRPDGSTSPLPPGVGPRELDGVTDGGVEDRLLEALRRAIGFFDSPTVPSHQFALFEVAGSPAGEGDVAGVEEDEVRQGRLDEVLAPPAPGVPGDPPPREPEGFPPDRPRRPKVARGSFYLNPATAAALRAAVAAEKLPPASRPSVRGPG